MQGRVLLLCACFVSAPLVGTWVSAIPTLTSDN